MIKKYFLLAIGLIFLFQCKQPQEAVPESSASLPEDFELFFEKFHVDSLFQVQHIQFPLDGARKATASNLDLMIPVKWDRESWIMHKPFNDHNGTFTRTFYHVGPVVIEKISDKNQFFSMERRFARLDNDWNLIYYSVSN